MTVVTVSAHRGAGIAASDGFCVNAFSIRKEWAIANAASLHHRFVSVTPAAGFGNVRPGYCRILIAGRQDRSHVAILRVAIKTRRRFRSVVNGLGMETVIILSVRRRVEERTCQIGKCLRRAVASLTLKRRRRGRHISIRPADNASLIRFYGRRRGILRILIVLRFGRFERVQTERSADQGSSQEDCECKIASHGISFLFQERVKECDLCDWRERARKIVLKPSES